MKIALFSILPTAAAVSLTTATELRARGHTVVERNFAAFDGQGEGCDNNVLMLTAGQAATYEKSVEAFVEIFDHKATPVRLIEVEGEEGDPVEFELEGEDEFFERFGAEAPPPSEKLSKLQARAIQLGVPFDASTDSKDLAEAIEQAKANALNEDEEDEDEELEEQKQLRQRLEALPDDGIRKLAKEEYDHTFPGNAKTETMVKKLVEMEGEKHDQGQ